MMWQRNLRKRKRIAFTLNADCLSTLPVGDYTLGIVSSNGQPRRPSMESKKASGHNFSGTDILRFSPANPCTRARIVTFLRRAMAE